MFLILGQLRCRNGKVRIDKVLEHFLGWENLGQNAGIEKFRQNGVLKWIRTVNWKFHPTKLGWVEKT